MTIKTADEIRLMEKACRLAAQTLQHTGKHVRAGITTDELDKIADDYLKSHGAVSACVGYHGYPKAICTSVNDIVCHGLPDETVLRDGDIVNIDVTALLHGFHGDTSCMFFVGEVSEKARKISACAFDAMHKGIEAIRAGGTTGDIGFAVEKFVNRRGFYAVHEIGGHGVGREFHEEPFIPSHGKKGRGPTLYAGGCITVEPMVNETSAPVRDIEIPNSEILIYATSDGTLSAQYEHTVLITEDGPRILTLA